MTTVRVTTPFHENLGLLSAVFAVTPASNESNAERGSFAETCAIRALRCVLGAFQPLTIHQLVEAVAIEPGGAIDRSIDGSYILDVCSNFILVDVSESVSLAHLSVREYLEQKETVDSSSGHCGDPARIFAFGHTQRDLAESCLTTVLHSALQKRHDGEGQTSFLTYALAFWPAHCERIPEERRNGALSLMMTEVMSSRVDEWAMFVPDMYHEFVMSKRERDRLYYMSLCDPYPYVVAAWGFLEFFTDAMQGASPISSNEFYVVTPLQLASQYGHADLVARILTTAPHEDVQVSGGPSLWEACRYGYIGIAQLLISAVPSSLLLAPYGVQLQVACEHGHLEIVELLINAGAEINVLDYRGNSPLQAACRGGQLEVVQHLLDRGADVNLGSEGHNPALASAVEWRREDIVRLLLERGADPNAIPSLPGSALESAACRSLAIVELLVDSGGAIVDGVDGRYGDHCILRCCLGRRRSCAPCWIGERILMRTANSTSPWL
jgi:hypothetical protein